MSSDAHAADGPDPNAAAGDHHATTDHGDDHGHDDHAHGDGEALGPIDTAAWLAGGLGVVLGLAVTVCFILATSALVPA